MIEYKDIRESQFCRKRVLKNNKLIIRSKHHYTYSDTSCAHRNHHVHKIRKSYNRNKTKVYWFPPQQFLFNEMHEIKHDIITEMK